ncbi:MAG: glycosyltransferase family 4 protein [Candidatus Marinimicrobia bacterium]|nr:glycosyltransferase family 4 protein [Candidatus Neomarinimicrobiota bacterium]
MKILTLNSHEAYVCLLTKLGYPIDIVDYLPGRYTKKWDERIRPIPENAELITLEEANKRKYDVIIAHSITDLLDVKNIEAPKILKIDVSLTGYIHQQGSTVKPQDVISALKIYIDKFKIIPVSTSEMKAKTWGLEDCIIVPLTVDTDFFSGYTGEISAGLRIANQIAQKSLIYDIGFFIKVIEKLPFKIVGYNPELPDVEPARDINELREQYQKHRFYLHTARYDYEDGFNLASLEAMSTGMPILTNQHPSSPVINGINGFSSNDPHELTQYALELLNDRNLAIRLGKNAREYVIENHNFQKFKEGWEHAIYTAIMKFS